MSTQTGEEPAPPSRRGRGTVLDMVRSLALVLLLIGAIALITIRGSGGDEVRVVDYAADLEAARDAAPYDVLAPTDLDGYQATSVRFTAAPDGSVVWHLGFVSPLEEYVGVDQSDGSADSFVDELTEGAAAVGGSAGTVELAGRAWERYDEGGDQDDEQVRGLVSENGDAVTVVSGTAGWPELEEMATALTAS